MYRPLVYWDCEWLANHFWFVKVIVKSNWQPLISHFELQHPHLNKDGISISCNHLAKVVYTLCWWLIDLKKRYSKFQAFPNWQIFAICRESLNHKSCVCYPPWNKQRVYTWEWMVWIPYRFPVGAWPICRNFAGTNWPLVSGEGVFWRQPPVPSTRKGWILLLFEILAHRKKKR